MTAHQTRFSVAPPWWHLLADTKGLKMAELHAVGQAWVAKGSLKTGFLLVSFKKPSYGGYPQKAHPLDRET